MQSQSNSKWSAFLLITLFSLWFGGYVQREINNARGSHPAPYYDFQVYYTAGLVARSDTDKRPYSYREIQDPEDLSKKIAVNPQLQNHEPDSTFGHFTQDKSTLQYI